MSIGRVLREKGFDVLVTGREYDFTRGIIEKSGLPYRIAGGYGGASLYGKLAADIERMQLLARIAYEFKPDVLVSYPIPASVRVAFGLAVPVVVMSDSPHSRPVHILTVPLAKYLVHSSLIPTSLFQDYLTPTVRVMVFHGVEEWEWVSGHRCDRSLVEALGLQPGSYIVFRTPEFKASYYTGDPLDRVRGLVLEALRRGYQVVAFPRYPDDAALLRSMAEKHPGDIIVVEGEPVETLDLYCYAAGVVTGGATMAREAALMCKPSVSLYPVYVNIVLEKMGLPIRNIDITRVESPEQVISALEDAARSRSTCDIVKGFEKPSSVVLRVVEELSSGKPS